MKSKYKIKAEDFLGATCELADKIMESKYPEKELENYIKYEDKEKTCSYFTDEGQEIFNEILEGVEETLYNYGIIHEGAEWKIQ